MSQFKYTLPSGAEFTMTAPAGTTQAEADFVFYSQVASGALVGFVPGQSISGTQSTAVKFALSRLDRGTAGVDDQVILSIIGGLPAIGGIPNLINVPLEDPITQADFVSINAENTFAPTSIGPLTPSQVQGIMSQISNFVNTQRVNLGIINSTSQSTTSIDVQGGRTQLTANQTVVDQITGIGIYGAFCEQLEQAGYVKPGTYLRFIAIAPNDFVSTMNSPGIWTGFNGIYSLDEFLNSLSDQNTAQLTLMQNGYESLTATGVIIPPASQPINAIQGYIYTENGLQTVSQLDIATGVLISTSTTLTDAGSLASGATTRNSASSALTSTLTNTVVGGVGALVANASKYGTEAVTAWARNAGLGNLTDLSNLNVGSISTALNKLPGSLTSLTNNIQNLDVLGKASQFATSFANPSAALTNLTGQLQGQLTGQATALVGQLQGQATALVGQATAIAGQLQGQATAIAGQLQGAIGSLGSLGGLFGGGGDSLVSATKVAAGFTNTVNRSAVNAAVTRLIGSAKVPIPQFGFPSLGASADISAAKNALQGLQGQATSLTNQARTAVTRLI